MKIKKKNLNKNHEQKKEKEEISEIINQKFNYHLNGVPKS